MAFLMPIVSACPSPDVTSRHIARIVESIPCKLPDDDGLFGCKQLNIDRPLYVKHNGKAVEQVGVYLFTDDMRLALDSVVCGAIERLWLELLLCNNMQQQIQLLRDYRVTLVLDGFPLGAKQFSSLEMALKVLIPNASLSMEKKDGKIRLCAESEAGTLIINLPADREFLFACDKKEHEDRLDFELQSWKGMYMPDSMPDISELVSIGEGIYVLRGNAYMIDALRSDIYYKEQFGQMTLLLDHNFPEYSLRNVLMGYAALDKVVLNLKYCGYDVTGKTRVKLWKTFLGYMQSQGMQFYAATYVTDTLNIHGILLMYHPIYEYAHMLVVNEHENLFADERIVLKGDLHTFIPQHYIEGIFK